MKSGLRADVIKAGLEDKTDINMEVIVHETIDSTNNWSLQQCRQGKTFPFACFAEHQTSGRGRRGKTWIMSPGSNIAMSLCWSFALTYQQLLLLPLSIALAIVKTLEEINLEHVQIKWPNDVYLAGKKIAGVLIETHMIQNPTSESCNSSLTDCHIAAIIGVGLNYDMSAYGVELHNNTASAFAEITDILRELSMQRNAKRIEREQLASMLLQNIVATCQYYQQDSKKNLELFRSDYDYCRNKNVDIVLDDQKAYSGIAMGITDSAELLVKIDGEERVFNSADVSVKARRQ